MLSPAKLRPWGHVPQLPAFMLDPAAATLSTTDHYARLLAAEDLPASYYLETADFNAAVRTGLRLLNFGRNGQIVHQARMIPIDIHLPILEIMAVLSQRGDLAPLNDYMPAELPEEFERFAPEYLAYQRQGRATEYSYHLS
ncbi:uncharacterized protein N7482_006145 [Penicillium canariense]|uniref:Uncharacterized protein n=1 Tax=Penicillium canariense TaxID=189055 RepID=A0A9W9LMZ0_9EURO|nr:uncharacterized protein N7482_006145 [Penicillium canariense]KAJ5167364.1 hypothetical protein N7482_006145 [Penicillium canariense]